MPILLASLTPDHKITDANYNLIKKSDTGGLPFVLGGRSHGLQELILRCVCNEDGEGKEKVLCFEERKASKTSSGL